MDNRNRDLNESNSIPQKLVIGLLRLVLPPHVDNERAADYLSTQIGQNNNCIEWIAELPDDLVNKEKLVLIRYTCRQPEVRFFLLAK